MKFIQLGLMVLIVSSCQVSKTEVNKQLKAQTRVYECNENYHFVARVKANKAWLFLPEKALELNREISASGIKFANNNTVFWTKNNTASLKINDNKLYRCTIGHLY